MRSLSDPVKSCDSVNEVGLKFPHNNLGLMVSFRQEALWIPAADCDYKIILWGSTLFSLLIFWSVSCCWSVRFQTLIFSPDVVDPQTCTCLFYAFVVLKSSVQISQFSSRHAASKVHSWSDVEFQVSPLMLGLISGKSSPLIEKVKYKLGTEWRHHVCSVLYQ